MKKSCTRLRVRISYTTHGPQLFRKISHLEYLYQWHNVCTPMQSEGDTHHTCTQPCTVRYIHKLSHLQHCTVCTHIPYPENKQTSLYRECTEIAVLPGYMGQRRCSWIASLRLTGVIHPALLQRLNLLFLHYTQAHVDSPTGNPTQHAVPITLLPGWHPERGRAADHIRSRFTAICIKPASTQVLNKRARCQPLARLELTSARYRAQPIFSSATQLQKDWEALLPKIIHIYFSPAFYLRADSFWITASWLQFNQVAQWITWQQELLLEVTTAGNKKGK